jgi:hypothetical protein
MHDYYHKNKSGEVTPENSPKRGTKRNSMSPETEAASIPLKNTPAKKRQKRTGTK